MINATKKPDGLWSIVLAGGEGERIRPWIERWLGRHCPKQYCTFVGKRSLFQHTLDRADLLTTPEQKVIITARDHGQEVRAQLHGRRRGRLVQQPANRGTAPGIFLALSYVRAFNPDATVVIYPSDHFVHPEERFIDSVRQTTLEAERLPDRLILLGVVPDRLELEYGWIQPGRKLGWRDCQLQEVRSFIEKPCHARAKAAMVNGALWNTLVMIGKVDKLWQLGWLCVPEMMWLFEIFVQAVGTPEEETLLESLYSVMPSKDFSAGLLERIPDQAAVHELREVIWSDWGRPERIASTLYRIGKRPAFPAELLAAS